MGINDIHRAQERSWKHITAKASLSEIEAPSDWDYCQALVELKYRAEYAEKALREATVWLMRLSDAVANIHPDPSEFFASIMPDSGNRK
jgi:hypothetical protein